MESEGSRDCDNTKIMKKSWTQDRLTALCIIILTGSCHIKHNSSLTPPNPVSTVLFCALPKGVLGDCYLDSLLFTSGYAPLLGLLF